MSKQQDKRFACWCCPVGALALSPPHPIHPPNHHHQPNHPPLQVVNNQLASLTAERQELADQVATAATRGRYQEGLARAREQDVAGGLGLFCWLVGREGGSCCFWAACPSSQYSWLV